VAELNWMADHKFAGVYGPGYLHHSKMPPLYDLTGIPTGRRAWNATSPSWSTPGTARVWKAFPQLEKIYNDVATRGKHRTRGMFAHPMR